MTGRLVACVRTRRSASSRFALGLGLLTGIAAPQFASAADCHGHPDALGTSRILVVDPRAHPRIGTMQYPETLPLEDHEVVLTFDDGPLPRNSDQILEILAAQCVKATFFTIGKMAQAYPEGVRKLRDAGHTIGTHSWDHPLGMNRMSDQRTGQEIDQGIAAVTSALGDNISLAPFFRIPGLARAPGIEDYLAAQGIQIWSADFPADDWRHVSAARVHDLAMQRLEDKGRGILLLHDIQAKTVAALPRILHDLKARGYRIVHVVPSTLQDPPTPTEPQQWQLHPPSEAVAILHWPKIPNFVFADTETLPAPALSELDWHDGQLTLPIETFDRPRARVHGVPLPREAPWPRQSPPPPLESAAIDLPVPSENIFEIRDRFSVPAPAIVASSHETEGSANSASEAKSASEEDSRPVVSRRTRMARPYRGRIRATGASRVAAHASHPVAHTRRSTLKHLVQVKKRSV